GGIEILAPQPIEALQRLGNAKDYGWICQLQSLGLFGEVHIHDDHLNPFLTAARPHSSSRGGVLLPASYSNKSNKSKGAARAESRQCIFQQANQFCDVLTRTKRFVQFLYHSSIRHICSCLGGLWMRR